MPAFHLDEVALFHETRDPAHLITWYPMSYGKTLVATHFAGSLALLIAPGQGTRAWLIVRDQASGRCAGWLCATQDEAKAKAESIASQFNQRIAVFHEWIDMLREQQEQ